jgi:hypothetical protein
MRKLLLLTSVFGALVAASAISARANTMSFTLTTAGALSISAPSGNVSLGSQMSLNAASTITGQLGVVTVSDQRGGSQTWTASVIAGAFTPPSGTAIAASAISYAAGPITVSGVVATAVAAPDLTAVSTVATGSGTGVSTASWNPTIAVIVPASFAAGIYTSVITHSVA